MKVFLISGHAGSGKDEVASIISKTLPSTVITSLSKYIKLFAKETTSWNGTEDTKPRELLQSIGDTLRSIDINFLTSRLIKDLEVYEKLNIENVVISDIRLINEINYIKENTNHQVITIRVNSDTSKRYLTEREKNHKTETELDNYSNFDYIVKNNFDNKLKEDINNLLKGMK